MITWFLLILRHKQQTDKLNLTFAASSLLIELISQMLQVLESGFFLGGLSPSGPYMVTEKEKCKALHARSAAVKVSRGKPF